MEQHGLKRIGVAYWKSVRTTMDGLSKFAGSIQEAITEATVMTDFDGMINNDLLEEIKSGKAETEEAKPTKKGGKKKAT